MLSLFWGQADALITLVHFEHLSPMQSIILWELRFPRVLATILVGAGLAVSGVAMQALFRNPLAEPGFVGISAGAALGAVLMIVLGPLFWIGYGVGYNSAWLALGAFAMAFLVTVLLHRLSTQKGQTQVGFMLLAGVALNAFSAALTGLLVTLSDDQQLRSVIFWMMGSFSSVQMSDVLLLCSVISLGLAGLWRLASQMDVYLLGEETSQQMGYDPQPLKSQIMWLSALMVGVSVALVGVISFVGLIVPHIMRLWFGVGHRELIVASSLGGAILLTIADWAARLFISPAELPIGLLMALIGAPFFLIMLINKRQGL
ncbi:MAG: iron ABC transporter permease [Thiotrichales bacterium]|nr:iron ABC transporter permease [Thiotrichales bacterium]